MQAHKIQVKLTAGVVVRIIDKGERGGSHQRKARNGYVSWSMDGATGPVIKFSSAEHGKERKTTLKIKSHRFWKPFQVAAGQSINTTIKKIYNQNICRKKVTYNIQQ